MRTDPTSHFPLAILCVLSFAAGATIFASAQSAIHEIEAFVLFLIGAVFLVRRGHSRRHTQPEKIVVIRFTSRSHDAVIRVLRCRGNVIETHEHAGTVKEW